jgi:uncharacterized membrane protein
MERTVLALHLMFIAMGTGMSFSNLVNTRLAIAKGGEFAKGLALQRRTIAQIGDGVIALIWVSGLALLWLTPFTPNAWLYAKIAFVIILTACHGLARRTAGEIMRTGDMSLLPRLRNFIAGVWLCALIAIALAVIAFS